MSTALGNWNNIGGISPAQPQTPTHTRINHTQAQDTTSFSEKVLLCACACAWQNKLDGTNLGEVIKELVDEVIDKKKWNKNYMCNIKLRFQI